MPRSFHGRAYFGTLAALTLAGGALIVWVIRHPDASYALLWTMWALHMAWALAVLSGLAYAGWCIMRRLVKPS